MTERSEATIGVVIAAVFPLIGIGLIAWGVALYRQRVELIAHGQRTTGVITGFERVGSNAEHELAETFLVPVVRYQSGACVFYGISTDNEI